MINPHVGLERRAAQRFGLAFPICIRLGDSQKEGHGFTQDLSNRGAYFYTDCALQVGEKVEITLVMPAEITLSENMRVRCRSKVLRLDNSGHASRAKSESTPKLGVAVYFEHYEYLADAQAGCKEIDQYERLATLHQRSSEGDTPDSPPDGVRNLSVR